MLKTLVPALAVTLLLMPNAVGSEPVAEDKTLRVVLYPFVPQSRELFFELEAAFEARHQVNVELVESYVDAEDGSTKSIAENYYKGGLEQSQADVYEIDTVLLDRMVEKKKIQPVSRLPRNYVAGAPEAVQYGGMIWAIPHWVCGNFLFYQKGDKALEEAKTWNDLAEVFQTSAGLVFDMKGASTLGEWYLTGLALHEGDPAKLLEKVQSVDLDRAALESLTMLLDRCPAGYCRNNGFHERAGYYARVFAHRRARAYIGYSESVHYALQEMADNCGPHDGCLEQGQIAVRELPAVTSRGKQVGWVDALAISADLPEHKKQLALEFIDFLTSKDGYDRVLEPEWPSAPRYLLPAVLPGDSGPRLSSPFYREFYRVFGSRILLTGKNLNETLRSRGKALECALPPDRGDTEWASSCPKKAQQ